MSDAAGTLWTIGHSTREWDVFMGMLAEAGIDAVVDVRRFAGSRRNPQYSPDAMAPALRAAGLDYLPMPELGGRRTPLPDSPNGAWRVAAFRGYADYMATDGFVRAREQLQRSAAERRCAVMCAEAVWWRCHRRLIADDLTLRGWRVLHLLAPGRCDPHPLHPAARLDGDAIRYPPEGGAQAALF